MNLLTFKKPIFLFSLFIIFFQLLQIIFFQKSFFLEKYDASYWKDRYEHSQYTLPLSKRIIGDDGLYAYVGYRLMRGDDPTYMHANKTPFGLYIIGLSILLFKSPAFYAFILGIGTLVVFFLVTHSVLKNMLLSIQATALLFLDPLFFSQLWKPLLDIAQAFFLLAHFALFLAVVRKFRRIAGLAFLTGLALGFFVEIKPPALFPLLFVLETIYFFISGLKKSYLFYIGGIAVGVLIPYIRFFLLGHNLLDFARLHKHILSLYVVSKNAVDHSSLWQTVFLGRFPDVSSGVPTNVGEWSIMLPIVVTLALIASVWVLIKDKEPGVKIVAAFLLGSFVVSSVISFYPRYLVALLPLCYFIAAKTVGKRVQKILPIILIVLLVRAWYFLSPTPDSLLHVFRYSLSQQYFRDIYEENIAEVGKPEMSGEEFRILAQKTLNDAQVRAIIVEEPRFIDKETIRFNVVYKTQDLGFFGEQKTAKLVQEHGRWRLVWDWDLLLNDFSPDSIVETKLIVGERGSLLNPQGQVLAEDNVSILVSVNPEKIDTKKKFELLKFLEKSLALLQPPSYQSAISLQNAYLENALPGEDVSLVTFHTRLSDNEKNYLLSFPGVTLQEYPSRIFKGLDQKSIKNTFYEECCTHIYSSYNYHGISVLKRCMMLCCQATLGVL